MERKEGFGVGSWKANRSVWENLNCNTSFNVGNGKRVNLIHLHGCNLSWRPYLSQTYLQEGSLNEDKVANTGDTRDLNLYISNSQVEPESITKLPIYLSQTIQNQSHLFYQTFEKEKDKILSMKVYSRRTKPIHVSQHDEHVALVQVMKLHLKKKDETIQTLVILIIFIHL